MARVLGLAPDETSRAAARTLTRRAAWSGVGSGGTLLWGRYRGSGREPYQVSVDVAAPSLRCSCPSRKQPCKHALALLLGWVRGDWTDGGRDAVPEAVVAAHARAQAAAAAAGARGPVADPEAAARRVAAREESMTAGLEDFGRWLADLVQEGLAAARRQPYTYWDGAAARLVDAQLPGLAERVRTAGGAVHARPDWVDALLADLGRWHLAVRAWPRRAALPEAVAADLRTYLGWPRRKDEIAAGTTVAGRWVVAGLRLGGDDRLRSQRTWLLPESGGDPVLLLDFAAVGGDTGLPVPQVLGSVLEATVALYPGSPPCRALLTGDQVLVGATAVLPGAGSIDAALQRAAGWFAANPWQVRAPVALAGVTPVVTGDRAWLALPGGACLPLAPDANVWRLLAITGGRSCDLFGEIADGRLHPTTAAVDGHLEDLPGAVRDE